MPVSRSLNSYFQDVTNTNNNRSASNTKKSFDIEGLFKPTMKDGKFSVVMRFLPCKPVEGEAAPFVENRGHMAQLPNGQWLGCDCLKKFELPCPICEYNQKMYAKYGREDARSRVLAKWQPKYYSNILIVKNPNAPETEGKVFRFEFKRQIMKFIADAMQDKTEDDTGETIPGINPFSWYGPDDIQVKSGEERAGANFVFEGYQTSNGPNYTNSHFTAARRISKVANGKLVEMTDAEIDAVEAQLFTLKDIEHKVEDCRTYDQILESYKKKTGNDLFAEFGETSPVSTNAIQTSVPSDDDDDDIFGAPVSTSKEPANEETLDNDDFFSQLANG